MFFADPVAAFTNISRALRPGARLVMLVWQRRDLNEWATAIDEALSEATHRSPPLSRTRSRSPTPQPPAGSSPPQDSRTYNSPMSASPSTTGQTSMTPTPPCFILEGRNPPGRPGRDDVRPDLLSVARTDGGWRDRLRGSVRLTCVDRPRHQRPSKRHMNFDQSLPQLRCAFGLRAASRVVWRWAAVVSLVTSRS